MNKRTAYMMIAVVAMTLTACAATSTGPEKIALKGGATLFIHPAGNMTMTDAEGKPIKMRDDVPMEATDGSMYIMHNRLLYKGGAK